ncbi:hypothetical protein A3H26_01240 [candidate division WWE3 bacterium RIFCSPLOWO2_12_FULL_36_10]|uniref:Uncharacterized protein n=1 Tax=candidate division WWE3 bacterium RIFCSPLOWO2_12_FULL_36_10 TaxID=1802630 RepID=A0A1F4VJU9_UNCKA|nr:MAG: hypothetical protein A3H26_01240 [candidate division WWE3 bacterium RIFCSPLOWO2_12_FULL_36_10]
MEDVTPQIQIPDSENADFICPKDGKISQNDVVFLCNKCKQADLVLKGGIYMCPTCFFPGENFECMLCGSKEVRIKFH